MAALAQDSDLDPLVWQSPSGEFALEIDPSAPDGGGDADYRLTRKDKEIWSGTRPFTLWQTEVTDEGVVFGFAYTDGIHSSGGELAVVRIGVDGEARACRSAPRRSPREVHGTPTPRVTAIFIEPEKDRIAFGLRGPGSGDEPFWCFRISDGEQLPVFPVVTSTHPHSRSIPARSTAKRLDSSPLAATDLPELEPVVLARNGSDPAPRKILRIEMDPSGRVYALEVSRDVVSVFDSRGTLLPVCEPTTEDRLLPLHPLGLTRGTDGSVYWSAHERHARGKPIRFLSFGPDGRRVGWVSLGLDWPTETWHFDPSGGRWVVGLRKLFRIDPEGSVTKEFARGPDRTWLRNVRDSDVAPDGSIALLTAPDPERRDGYYRIHIYGADCDPKATFNFLGSLSPSLQSLAWDGRWLVLARSGWNFLLVDTVGDRRFSFEPPFTGPTPYGRPFLVGEPRELRIAEPDAGRIRRFSLPSD